MTELTFSDGDGTAAPVTTDPPAPEPSETDPLAPDANAPWGYTIDRATGAKRPKKRAGRPKADDQPESEEPAATGFGSAKSVDDLKAGQPIDRPADRTPSRIRAKRGFRTRTDRAPKEEPELPPFRAGPIAKGMNRLYAKAGKLIKVMDPEVGNAILSVTKKDSDDDVTVGEAWEELAKTNPRIRAVLLKMISGGAWGGLFMAHAPIFLAVVMKPAVAKHIPFQNLVGAFLTDEDGEPSEESESLGGLNPEDVGQMVNMANGLAAQMGMGKLDLGAMMRGMATPTGRAPSPAGDQYAGFEPPPDGSHG